jgi:hypothetical protein
MTLLATGALHHVNMLEIIRHPWFISAISAFLGAQILKFVIAWVRQRKCNFHELRSSGGMPSSHSSLVAALACAIGFTDGFDAPYAMIAVGFGLIVLCDAATLRREAGEHAKILNIIIRKLNDKLDEGERIEVSKLKERLGHKRREVLAGVLFGIGVALAVCAIWDFWK